MTKRKVLIALGVLASAVAILVLVGMASVINMLPGPKAIAKKLSGPPPAAASSVASTEVAPTTATTSAMTTSAAEVTTPETPEQKSVREKKIADQKNEALLAKLLSEDPTDIRVCDNLGRKQLSKEDILKERDFNEMMSDRDDPMNEAFRYPILQVFNDPNLRSFLSEVKDIKQKTDSQTQEEKESWLEKAGFYSRLAYTAGRVYARKSEFEHMGNQAQHLSALARLAALKPEVAAGGQLQTLCRSIQGKARDGQTSDLISDRRELIEIFRSAGVDPKTVGFDPKKWIHFTTKFDKKNFSFNLSDDEQPTQATDSKKTAKNAN